MLQYDTPNGIYTFREKDYPSPMVQGLWRDTKRRPMVTIERENHHDIEDLESVLRSEPFYTPDGAVHRLLRIRGVDQKSILYPNEPKVTIQCTDGPLSIGVSYYKRRFQLIDGYFTDNPGADTMTLPYTRQEFEVASQQECGDLEDCYECLMYLNPKSNMYPFYLGVGRTPLHVINQLADKLTTEERSRLVAYGERRGLHLPSTEGACVLAVLPGVRVCLPLFYRIFPLYPSFVWCHHIDMTNEELGQLTALLTMPFSLDKDVFSMEPSDIATLVRRTLSLMTHKELTVEQLRTIGAMIHRTPSTQDIEVTLPNDIDLGLFGGWTDLVYKFISRLKDEEDSKLAELRREFMRI